MDQYSSIRTVRRMLQTVIETVSSPETAAQLQEIDQQLECFHDHGIDFKEIIDNLDDSILITDADGTVVYINPAYTTNTGITPQDVLQKDIRTLIGPDRMFTGGVVLRVLDQQTSVFRLSTTYKTDPPLLGYVVGTPVFQDDGSLRQVIACSRPLITLSALQEDFETFQKEIASLQPKTVNIKTEESLSDSASGQYGIVGKYGSLAHICQIIEHIAPTDATVLITGESGVGKEVVADEIYRHSHRNGKPYVKINCASIPNHLLESELFGYERGAFTGANTKGKMGLFECANGGTLMLDEIGDMPMDLQVKLLRAIQSQEITRIGGTRPIKLDIRILALTNADLKAKVDGGTFRRDLFYRLNVIPIQVPPLRERLEDIEELCRHFISTFSQKYNRSFRLTPRQLEYLKQYSWPGNIRELENVMEYLIVCSTGVGYVLDDMIKGLLGLTEDIELPSAAEPAAPWELPDFNSNQGIDYNQAVMAFEKQLLEKALSSSTNLLDASQKLNINASTISRKIKQYKIDYPNKRS